MLTVEEHRDRIFARVRPGEPVLVPLDAAEGLVLAADVHATWALPAFDNSAMDGYAVLAADVAGATTRHPVTLTVVADLPAGTALEPELRPGTAARIMTGAPVPRTAEAVVPVEATDGGTMVVEIRAPARRGQHIRRAGEDVVAGERVLEAGIVLRAPQVAAAAATGHGVVRVHPRPRVAVISTGSELVPPGEPVRRGLIPDSNSLLLAAAVREAGCEAVRIGAVPDDAARLEAVLEALLRDSAVDAVVTSGGVSVGAYDVVKEHFAARRAAHDGSGVGVTFDTVAMQPGKPQGFGVLPRADGARVPLFALPGNPVSAYVSFEVFVRPALLRMRGLGGGSIDRRVVRATAASPWRAPSGRRQYLPVRLRRAPGGWEAVPAGVGGSGSHLAVTLAAADGLAVVDLAVDEVRPGDVVDVMLTAEAPS